MLPKNWTPLPASHSQREFIVDLPKIGLASVGLAELLDPAFWKGHAEKLLAGDELRVRSPSLDATLQVITSSDAGVIVKQIAGGPIDRGIRNLVVCRTADGWTAVWALSPSDFSPTECYGPETRWQDFAAGQKSLPAILGLVADELVGGPFNVTIRSAALDEIKAGNGYLDPSLARFTAFEQRSASILCPQGRAWALDVWVDLRCQRRELEVSGKFVASQLAGRIREMSERMSEAARVGEYEWLKPYYQIALMIRPDWKAAELVPSEFPEPKSTASIDGKAIDYRKKKVAETIPRHKRPNGWATDPLWWLGMDL